MQLFPLPADAHKNLLPQDGAVYYHGPIFTSEEANSLFQTLQKEIAWQHDEVFIYGKRIVTQREVAWYGNKPFAYTYSKSTKTALPWTPALLRIKEQVEAATKHHYNSCLLNLYHNGSEGMAWHSDDEKELQRHGSIASVSLGAQRKFVFKHRQAQEKVELWLEHGSLLNMEGPTQDYWLHRLPPTKKVDTPRINLTFRTIAKTDL